jgi:type 1 glutamine amidotransferase
VRVAVRADYGDLEAIARSRFLVTYTCDVRPSQAEQEALARFVREGGRWLALHGTNSALDFTAKGVASPRCFPTLAHVLGSQFVAHPPIQPYRVNVCAPEHALVAGVEPFDTDDELYLSEYTTGTSLRCRHSYQQRRGRREHCSAGAITWSAICGARPRRSRKAGTAAPLGHAPGDGPVRASSAARGSSPNITSCCAAASAGR